MKRSNPPFRADHVGSLLRTAPLKEARARRETDEISADDLKAIEDREIAAIIRKQEDTPAKTPTATDAIAGDHTALGQLVHGFKVDLKQRRYF